MSFRLMSAAWRRTANLGLIHDLLPAPTRQSGVTKARRWDGEYEAAHGECIAGTRCDGGEMRRRSRCGSDEIRTGLQLFVLTRFLRANRYPFRSKTLFSPPRELRGSSVHRRRLHGCEKRRP